MTPSQRFDTMRTERLLMRRWRESDREPFAALNGDAETLKYFPSTLDRAASDTMVDRIEACFDALGYGLWALEVAEGPDAGRFAGLTGLAVPTFTAHFTPCVEVGWRLASWAWGRGYATEAASAALRYGFIEAGLDEVVSFTVPANFRSRAVMTRLGMAHDPADDFDHPGVPASSPLRRHVLYRLPRERWHKRVAKLHACRAEGTVALARRQIA